MGPSQAGASPSPPVGWGGSGQWLHTASPCPGFLTSPTSAWIVGVRVGCPSHPRCKEVSAVSNCKLGFRANPIELEPNPGTAQPSPRRCPSFVWCWGTKKLTKNLICLSNRAVDIWYVICCTGSPDSESKRCSKTALGPTSEDGETTHLHEQMKRTH